VTPNPFIERTATGKPVSAAHVKRYPDDGSERVGERRTAEAPGCSVAAALWRTAV